MNTNSNKYIIIYATVLVVVVAALLAFASTSLKPRQEANILIEKKGAILASIGEGLDADTAPEGKEKYINDRYDACITATYFVDKEGNQTSADAKALLDALGKLPEVFAAKTAMPVFEAKTSAGKKLYVLPLYGKGLWGPVWGYVSLNEDCNTIEGAVFDHKGETPGLGAEIALSPFSKTICGQNNLPRW